MSQMPQINGVVNKEPEKEKKKAGFLASLFGGGGSGTVGVGGFGGAGGLASGGLLATKAGLLALILAGTTVAGGIGVIGYRLFGPGQDQPLGDNLQLFAPKPKDGANANGKAAPQDGSSKSLQFLAQANGDLKAPDAGAEAPKDDAAASATGDATGANGPLNKADDGRNGVNKTMPNNAGKLAGFGASGGGGGGVGSSANAGSQKAGAVGDLAANAHKGTSTAMSRGAASSLGARAMVGRGFGSTGAAQQAFGVVRDNRGATSSAGGGTTYDGSSPVGSNIGSAGSAIGMPGVGTSGTAQPKATAGPATNTNTSQSIPTPPATEEAPWQHAITAAQVMLGIGGVLLFVMSKVGKANPIIFYALNAIVGLISAAIIALGAQIANGQYGQKLQGGVLAAAGAGLMIAAAMAAMSPGPASPNTPANAPPANAPAANAPAANAPAANAPAANAPAANTPSTGGSFLSGIPPYVILGGGAALIGLAGTLMMPPTKYPSTDFQNGTPPDSHWFGYQQLPSEAALKKMVA